MRCPITRKEFDCGNCPAVGKDGKCPYMKLDEWADDTLRVMRKLVEREYEKQNGTR